MSLGDRNTKYFHALASARQRKKAITKIHHQGSNITEQSQIHQVFLSHFKDLLGSSHQTNTLDIQTLYDHPPDLQHLDMPFSLLEVQTAVKELQPNKASGLDGLPNEFFKQHWAVLQPHIMHIFSRFYSHQTDLSDINQARIVLLPKNDTPTSVTDFRPISVLNLIPKLISKVLTNRIKPQLPHLVNEHQTTFVQGRLIAENFLATREVLHHVHHCGSPAILLKLDFAKAFDTLEWPFLMQVLQVRGFPHKMITWIQKLLDTASSSIQINGTLTASFKHRRGLRQGDPLSPYLFILAADVLQQMTTNISLAAPHRLTPKIPYPIINFQYADDTIIIASAKGHTLRLMILVIHCFSAASGLKVNLQKSSFLPLAIDSAHLRPIEQLLQCKQQSLPMMYLGMPLTLKAPTRSDYSPMLEKLEKRMEGWMGRFISRAGKLQLIKSVLSTIPVYSMSCFKFPKWLIARIDRIMRQFLWSRNGSIRGIHLINWPTICLPLKCGGMGVINLQLQNMALLLCWIWRLYAHDRKLWATYAAMLHAVRPVPDGPLILSTSGSFFWRALLNLRSIFYSASFFRAVSGKRISFWFDKWSGQIMGSTIIGTPPSRCLSLYGARHMVHRLLPTPLTLYQHQALHTLSQFIPQQGDDNLIWNLQDPL